MARTWLPRDIAQPSCAKRVKNCAVSGDCGGFGGTGRKENHDRIVFRLMRHRAGNGEQLRGGGFGLLQVWRDFSRFGDCQVRLVRTARLAQRLR